MGKSCVVLGLVLPFAASGCEARPDVLGTFSVTADTASGSASTGGQGDVVDGNGGSTSTGGTAATGGVSSSSGGMGGEQSLDPLPLTGDIEAHDITLIEEDGIFYVFHTGGWLRRKVSTDLLSWENEGEVFDAPPAWIEELLPEVTSFWAPELSFFGGVYHLYYAASTPGSRRSCIGHATKDSIGAPGAWADQGSIICTNLDENVEDDWDAIDPSIMVEPDGSVSMLLGSWSEGLKWIPLNLDGSRQGDEIRDVARRTEERGSVQAAEVHYRSPFFYLFVSFGQCCLGVESSSTLRMGRSREVFGPYVDREGVAMMDGGGSFLMHPDERFIATGANDIFTLDGQDYTVYHAYDVDAGGQAMMRISPVTWVDDWPEVLGP